MQTVIIVSFSTEPQECVRFVGNLAMINPDELEKELAQEAENLQKLIMRTTEQDEDIQELKQELQKLKEGLNDAEADTISSDDETPA